jgi:ADP-ribose pyrophosphatase
VTSPPAPWRILDRRRVFAGGPIREIAVETIELPDGRIIPDYYQIQLPDYVLIFAELTDGTVPMLRQYRHGLRRVCLAFPGGAIETGESPLEAAERELREELGCVSGDWELLGSLVTNANQHCNTAHLYRARRVERVTEPDSGDLEDTVVVYLEQAKLLAPGRVEEIGQATHIALLFLALQRSV